MSDGEPTSLRLVATMTIAGLISGLTLVGIYVGTLPMIQRNRAAFLSRAILGDSEADDERDRRPLLPGAESFTTMELRGNELVRFEGAEGEAPAGPALYMAYDADGQFVGYGIPAEGPGFQDTVALIYGFDATRRVIVGMRVLESRETPGLGDKIIFDEHFLSNFEALAVEPTIVPVKKGERSAPNEIDCITGATISSKAVVTILNRSTEQWLPRIGATPPAGGQS